MIVIGLYIINIGLWIYTYIYPTTFVGKYYNAIIIRPIKLAINYQWMICKNFFNSILNKLNNFF
jgi:hypothetical protein